MKKVNTIVAAFFSIFLASCTTIKTSQDLIPEDKRTYFAPYSKVYSNSVSALMALKWQISHSNKDEGLIQARTPMNLWTFGDLVTVHVTEESPGQVRVDITSGSPQQYDWGRNKENIEAFYSELQRRL